MPQRVKNAILGYQEQHDFAKVGFNIRQIKTREAFIRAIDANFAFEMQEFAVTVKGQDIDLDKILDHLPDGD